MKFIDYLKNSYNVTYTHNLAKSNISTFNGVLDLFGTMGASRGKTLDELQHYFIAAWAENPDLTARSIMYLRDPRYGMGERRVFRRYMDIMLKTHPLTAIEIIKQLPDLGRYDDIIYIWYNAENNHDLDKSVKEIVTSRLKEDMLSDTPSLLGKWLPSENASSKETKKQARKLIELLGLRTPEYRKILSSLRKKIEIIENNLSKQDYTFNYSNIPSLALKKYSKAFKRNDNERYLQFFKDVKEDKVKINTAVLTPFDVVRDILYSDDEITLEKRDQLDILWNNLPDVFGNETLNAIVASDISGSMGGEPLVCSVSLAIYIAKQNKGPFQNHYIDFCGQSRMHDISKINNICDIVKYVSNSSIDMSTNIDSVFDTLLTSAVQFYAKQDQLPKYIIIISDMEFNDCGGGSTNFQSWHKKYRQAGYKLPTIVFWNVNSTSVLMPAKANDNALFLSGRSQNILNALINIDKYEISSQTDIAMATIIDAVKRYHVEILD